MNDLGVIIVAGGSGVRMGDGVGGMPAPVPKQFLPLGGKTVLEWSVEAFGGIATQIVVALPEAFLHLAPAGCTVCAGGATRFQSVSNALAALSADCEWIAVHDGARPLVSRELIFSTLAVAKKHGSAVPVVPVVESVRRLEEGVFRHPLHPSEGAEGFQGSPENTTKSIPVDRSLLRAVQTPQIFRADILRGAYKAAVCSLESDSAYKNRVFTDDASVVEAAGFGVVLCTGERRNIKITEPDDLKIAASLLK